jgi:hypothetical protein
MLLCDKERGERLSLFIASYNLDALSPSLLNVFERADEKISNGSPSPFSDFFC